MGIEKKRSKDKNRQKKTPLIGSGLMAAMNVKIMRIVQ